MSRMYSQRGSKLPVVNDYKCRLHKILKSDIERWACIVKTCVAYVKYDRRDVIDQHLDHNHEPNSGERLNRQKVANASKQKATSDIVERPSKVMKRVTDADVLTTLTEQGRAQIYKSIRRARAKIRPAKPKTIEEVHVTQTSTKI